VPLHHPAGHHLHLAPIGKHPVKRNTVVGGWMPTKVDALWVSNMFQHMVDAAGWVEATFVKGGER
jgi:hypothetical protein